MNLRINDIVKLISMGLVLPVILCMLAWWAKHRGHDGPSSPTAPQATPPSASEPISRSYLISLDNAGKIQCMELEEYLVGVVLAEMPASFELEALKAQAVAARTYTIKQTMFALKHGDRTMCADYACCQAYIDPAQYLINGGSMASVARVRAAVEETAGKVLVYDGQLIDATYFSCSGGTTEDAVAVWGRDVAYLKSVPSPGEEDATYFTDQKTFTSEQFQAALGIRLKGTPSTWFSDVSYTAGGGVDHMTIGGVSYRGTTLRTLLGLRSTAFSVSVRNGWILIETSGYGHRVGMSQYGANARAKEGDTYDRILTYYYCDVDVVQYFEVAI